MSLLAHDELIELVEQGVITADLSQVNGSSIDLTLDKIIRVERKQYQIIDLLAKENIYTEEIELDELGYILSPGEFILASSVEVFNLPNDITAEYKLKSSQARNGMAHLLAGHCDSGWSGSKLTLEFHNVNIFHGLLIKAGMRCGQIIFHRHKPVPDHANYAVTGQYNNQSKVQESKGIR